MPWITSVLISKKASQYGTDLALNKANLDLLLDDASVCASSEFGSSGRLVSLFTAVSPGVFYRFYARAVKSMQRPMKRLAHRWIARLFPYKSSFLTDVKDKKKIGGLERATFHSGRMEGKGKLTFYLHYVRGPSGQSNLCVNLPFTHPYRLHLLCQF
jgi:hypothetical protein